MSVGGCIWFEVQKGNDGNKQCAAFYFLPFAERGSEPTPPRPRPIAMLQWCRDCCHHSNHLTTHITVPLMALLLVESEVPLYELLAI